LDSSAFVIVAALLPLAALVGLARPLLLTQRKAAANRYRDIAELLLSGSDKNRGWIWETNADGEIVFASDSLAASLGIAPDRVLGKELTALSGYPPQLRAWAKLRQAMRNGEDIAGHVVPIRVGSSRRWWQVAARPMRDGLGAFRGYRGIGQDVTVARRARGTLLLARERAERRLAARSQFLNVMSHELRTPLNAIIGFSEIIAEERDGPLGNPSYREFARSIVDSSRSLQSIISDILDAGRIERGSFRLLDQEVDAAELADAVIRRCRSLASQAGIPKIDVACEVQAEIRGDLVRLTQILTHLLTNAIKFTPRQGTVSLTVTERPGVGIAFTVTDSGIGIESKDLERVFEPFFQAEVGTSRHFGGTGLGLAIAKKLAEAHGGDITLDSAPGLGTRATFVIPEDRVIRHVLASPAGGSGTAAA
jgi:PAS domain S-box-containing protein